MADYLTPADDITDAIARMFVVKSDDRVTVWNERTTTAVNDLALMRGVNSAQVATPITGVLKDYALEMFAYYCCNDNALFNNTTNPETDKYIALADRHYNRALELSKRITPEIIQQITPENPGQMITGFNLYRG